MQQPWNTLDQSTTATGVPAPNRRPKGTGRKKIETLQKIENKLSRKVAFSKRRKGLFKKAKETCELCPDSQIAIIVFSAKGRLFSIGIPSVEVVIDRFLNDRERELRGIRVPLTDDGGQSAMDGVDVEEEEEEEEDEEEPVIGDCGEFWFDVSIGNLEVDELEEFVANLEGLVINLCMRHEELVMRRTCEVDYLANFG